MYETEKSKGVLYLKHVFLSFIPGKPDCGSMQQWPIYHYSNSTDVLYLLSNGNLRHYLYRYIPHDDYGMTVEDVNAQRIMFYDYEQGKYCMDKVNIKHLTEKVIVKLIK